MKKVILVVLALAMVFSCVACTNGRSNAENSPSASAAPSASITPSPEASGAPIEASKSVAEMAEELMATIEVSTMEADETMLTDIYHLNMEGVEEVKAYMAVMNVHAEDLILVKAKDEAAADAVEESLKKRNEDSVAIWETYLPAQFELVENHKLVRKGNYVLYVVSEKADDIVTQFESYFAG